MSMPSIQRAQGRVRALVVQAIGRVNDALVVDGAEILFAGDPGARYELVRARGSLLRAVSSRSRRAAELRAAQQLVFLEAPVTAGYLERVALALRQHTLELAWADRPDHEPGWAMLGDGSILGEVGRVIPGTSASKLAALQDVDPEAFQSISALVDEAIERSGSVH